GLLVLQRNLPNRQPAVVANLQQFIRARKQKGNGLHHFRPGAFPLAQDKSAANRKINLRCQHRVIGIERRESHPVRVRRQRLVLVPQQIRSVLERNLSGARQSQFLRRTNRRQLRFNRFRLDQIRQFAAQSQQNRAIRSVPMSRQRQRSIQPRPHPRHSRYLSASQQFPRKIRRRAHWPHRVRTRRPNPHFKNFKYAGLHGKSTQNLSYAVSSSSDSRSPPDISWTSPTRRYDPFLLKPL